MDARDFQPRETLGEKVARLEVWREADRDLSRLNYQILQGQIDSLRQDIRAPAITTPHGLATWVKVLAALLLPFLVYANLLSPEKAASVSRVVGGP